MFNSIAIKEMPIKMTLRFQLTSVRMALIKKQKQKQTYKKTANAGEDVGKGEVVGKKPLYSVGRNVN
jgi:hypothetical protein